MYTRCPGCHTVHPVNASLLAQGTGKYRCGKCKKQCNALDSLFDEWPAAGVKPPRAGELPVLGLAINLEEARKARLTPDEAGLSGQADSETETASGSRSGLVRSTWVTIAIVLAMVVTFELSDFYQQSLLEIPLVRSVAIRLGLQDPTGEQPYRDLSKIHLVSRELTSHTSRADMLRLTATIVNRARQTQPFPDLEVVLLDVNGEPLSRFRFSPSDYLASDAPGDSGMTPEAYLPLVLDLPDPGREAVGFELDFL